MPHWGDPKIDDLFKKGVTVSYEMKERKAIYTQIQKILAEEQAYVVLWTNEENGGRGGLGYRDRHMAELVHHVMMLESDGGVFRPTGFGFSGTIEETSEADMRELLDVNYMGAFNAIRAVLPHMRARRRGRQHHAHGRDVAEDGRQAAQQPGVEAEHASDQEENVDRGVEGIDRCSHCEMFEPD